ncbi:MAG: DUF3014 domain-containing protein [Oligosphaeraceae bacterium]
MRRSHLLIATLPPALLSGLLALFWDDLAEQVGVTPTPAATPVPLVEPAPTTAPETVAAPTAAPAAPSVAPTVAPTTHEEPKTEEPRKPSSPAEFAALLRERGAAVSENALWLEFVRHPQALETLVTALDQFGGGKRPLAIARLGLLPAPAPFQATERDDGTLIIAPETEQRLTPVVEAILSVSPQHAAALIGELEPELDRLLHETLGYPPEQTFRKLLNEALTVLLKTPLPDTPPTLVRVAPGLYHYQSQQLEQLQEAQKFILRLGIDNHRRLADYARQLWPLF